MSDLEDRLSEALRAGADDATYAGGGAGDLAAGARRRLATRRRRRTGIVGALAVLAVAVPTGVVAAHRGDAPAPAPSAATSGPSVASDASGSPDPVDDLAAGFRWVSWRGVSAQVPESWGTGTLTSWCSGGGDPSPRVATPDTGGDAIACTPAQSYGLRFSAAPKPGLDWPVAQQHNDGYPAGAYVGTRDIAGVLVEVATPTAALAQRVLDSVVATTRIDASGCATTLETSGEFVQAGFVTVCAYDADGELASGRTLDLVDSTTLRADVQDATTGPPAACPARPTGAVVRLLASDLDATVDLARGCLYVGGSQPANALPNSVRDLSLGTGGSVSSPAAG